MRFRATWLSWLSLHRPFQAVVLALGLLHLGGCASVYLVDNQVQSFVGWGDQGAPSSPQTFQFERMPSQRQGPASEAQDQLEALARTVLARQNWNLAQAPAAATWTVQVTARTHKLPRAPWEEPAHGPWADWGWGLRAADHAWGGSVFLRMDIPYLERQVSLVIRNRTSAQVVYETSARHDGRWANSPELWRAMLEAALRDFPRPPQGVRRVDIEVPR